MAPPVHAHESLVLNWMSKGALILAALGGLIGLIVGIIDEHGWRVAWFTTMELGIPSALVGAIIGAVAGTVAMAVRRVSHRVSHSN